MQLTLLFLLAWLQIYCNSAFLSLPPSLIARAASDGLQHSQQQVWQRQARAVAREQQTSIPLNAPGKMKKDVCDGSLDDIDAAASNRVSRRSSNIISNSDRNNNNNNNILSGISFMPRTSASSYNHNNNNANNEENEDEDNNNNSKSSKVSNEKKQEQQQQQQQRNLYELQHEYEINSLLAAAAAAQDEPQITTDLVQKSPEQTETLQSQSPSPLAIAPRIREIEWNEFFSPMKYWPRHRCHSTVDVDCPKEALVSAATTTAAQQQYIPRASNSYNASARDENPAILKDPAADDVDFDTDTESNTDTDDNLEPLYGYNDSLMLLSGEEELIKFLRWALLHLQPPLSFGGTSREGVSMDMNLWKKPNMSGQREPLLWADEPRYVQSRLLHKDEDPFIPPRGRKYQQHMSELDRLQHRFETFVPNRGKRDKIKDIFKYDDLFFPNRGKKQKSQPLQQQKHLREKVQWTDGDRYQRGQQRQQQRQQQRRQQNQQQFQVMKWQDVTEDEDFNGYRIVDNANRDLWTLPPQARASWIQPTTPSPATTSDSWSGLMAHQLWYDAPKNCLHQQAFDRHPKPVANINGGRRIAYNNNNDDNNNNHIKKDDVAVVGTDGEWPPPRSRMSTDDVKINEYDDQSVKKSMPTSAMLATATTEAQAIKSKRHREQRDQLQQQQRWQFNKVHKVGLAASNDKALARLADSSDAEVDGVADNRLHATRSMSTINQGQQIRQQQQPVKQLCLKSTRFNNWPFGQKSRPQQHFAEQHEMPPLMMLRHTLQLLRRNGARRSPSETQLAAIDLHHQQQQSATFIDGIDYDSNYNK